MPRTTIHARADGMSAKFTRLYPLAVVSPLLQGVLQVSSSCLPKQLGSKDFVTLFWYPIGKDTGKCSFGAKKCGSQLVTVVFSARRPMTVECECQHKNVFRAISVTLDVVACDRNSASGDKMM